MPSTDPSTAPCDPLTPAAQVGPGGLVGLGPLDGYECAVEDPWAAGLLEGLGGTVARVSMAAATDPAGDWAASGAMALSGAPHGAPLLAPGQPASVAIGAGAALDALHALAAAAGWAAPADPHQDRARFFGGAGALDGAALLGERAAMTGARRNAPWTLGGTCRAVRCADGWVAPNLARPDDRTLLAALFEAATTPTSTAAAWALCDREAAAATAHELVERADLLGLPLAEIGTTSPAGPASPAGPVGPTGPWRIRGRSGSTRCARPPRVVDLSTLWAGPLAASLLGRCGAEVVRVESGTRPDGSRSGSAAFDDLLHAGQPSVALDFGTPAGRDRLRRLIDWADVVVTSARGRALAGLGLDPHPQPGRGQVWVAVTAYGLGSNRVGYGDDCAMAGGLVRSGDDEVPVPVGDALADPLTGLHAAVAALACYLAGGDWLVDIALAEVAAAAAGPMAATAGVVPAGRVHRRGNDWYVETARALVAVAEPRARRSTGRARALGADTESVLAGLPR